MKNWGRVLVIGGADLLDGTPLYDIKPYIPYADCHPDCVGRLHGADPCPWTAGGVPAGISHAVSAGKTEAVLGILAQDPRPAYVQDPQRMYGMSFAGLDVKFRVEGDVLTVCGVERTE